MTARERLRHTGIRRVRVGRGFQFRSARGTAVRASEVERIRSLAIPPAWTEVVVAPSATSKLQAIGRDKAGRWQYRYHPRFRSQQDRRKYRKLVDFATALPRMRRQLLRDLRRPGLGRDKVLACAIRVISTCFMRPGSERYARLHHHYGLTTLRNHHATLRGARVTFDYPGKSGQPQHRELTDRTIASIVRRMAKLPGKELFKYVAEDGSVCDVQSSHLNAYIHRVMGPEFSAKDFRTWAGTLICACALARAASELETVKELPRAGRRKTIVAAVKETAAELGNTPAVSRNSYIEPAVLRNFEKGEVVEKYFETVEELVEHTAGSLHDSEKALKELLEAAAQPA